MNDPSQAQERLRPLNQSKAMECRRKAETAAKLRILDLFSGIGGFSLGLERAGMQTVAFCEIEPYCQAVLKKHWPEVPIYSDIRTLTGDTLARDGIAVDVICGGFPCQDVSHAGKRSGLEGTRSGLWSEYARLIGELRPQFVIVENVPGLLSLGMGTVLGDLSALGYDATWDCIAACAVGAPHRRDRVWIVAHTELVGPAVGTARENSASPLHDQDGERSRSAPGRTIEQPGFSRCRSNVADPSSGSRGKQEPQGLCQNGKVRALVKVQFGNGSWGGGSDVNWWQAEPSVGRVAHGVPARAHRLKALGNSVVPQVVEIIGKAIVRAHL